MTEPTPSRSRLPQIFGWIIAAAAIFMFGMSAVMKFTGSPEMDEGMTHLGIPVSLARPLGILELSCLVLSLIPRTAVLGAILLTGYLGGAIAIHLPVHDPFVVQASIAVLLWVGVGRRGAARPARVAACADSQVRLARGRTESL